MARVDVNTALGGLHGKIDGYVFRKQGDKTVFYALAGRGVPPSDGQKKTMRTFGDASHWVRTTIKPDPALQALYRKRGRARRKGRRNYRQMAISDYFHAPEVEGLDLAQYRAAEGGRLRVTATDDFEVVRVHVTLRDADGAVVAEGDASRDTTTSWHFDVTPIPAGGKPPVSAEVSAFDRPDNVTTRAFPLEQTSAATPIAPTASVTAPTPPVPPVWGAVMCG